MKPQSLPEGWWLNLTAIPSRTLKHPPLPHSLLECDCCQAIFLEGRQEHQVEDHG